METRFSNKWHRALIGLIVPCGMETEMKERLMISAIVLIVPCGMETEAAKLEKQGVKTY